MSLVTVAPSKRLTRPGQARAFVCTDRDLNILQRLASDRFVTNEQLARDIGASLAKTRGRTLRLWEAGFIDRPRQQALYALAFNDQGNRPLVYALTRKGAQLLRERRGLNDPRLFATLSNNARSTAPFMAHAIEVAEVMLGFRGLAPDAPQLIDQAELLPLLPEATRSARDPFRLSVNFEQESRPVTLRVRPDRLFSLYMPDQGRRNFGLELDRSTEPILPRSTSRPRNSSIAKKLLAYFHAHRQKIHSSQWGFQSFRVLFITDSETRLQHMIAAQRQLTRDRLLGLFLFTTKHRLAEAGGPLAPVWSAANADGVSLITQPATAIRS